MSDRIKLIHMYRAPQTYLGHIGMIAGYSFCTIVSKQKNQVFIGTPAGQDFLEVLSEQIRDGDAAGAIQRAHHRITDSKPKLWAETFSERALKKAELHGWSKDYVKALRKDVQ